MDDYLFLTDIWFVKLLADSIQFHMFISLSLSRSRILSMDDYLSFLRKTYL